MRYHTTRIAYHPQVRAFLVSPRALTAGECILAIDLGECKLVEERAGSNSRRYWAEIRRVVAVKFGRAAGARGACEYGGEISFRRLE